ncbi:DUF4397 domain-containing protein [Danxiaibacter flavus]|uniref:DUF4397 domain-containing protein n=1 Tax=Danxiaibacter flavus TaxID=3049108 RepID=A0ABV3ZHH6_9BACT|nr:DUF4397 domain-containing protein [Chitinophagaceae bacterium DXS]
MTRFRKGLFVVAALLTSVLAIQCSKTHVTAANSSVMLINASPDAPTGITLWGNGDSIFSNVNFGDSTAYAHNLITGTYGMKLTKTGQTDSLFSFIATWLPARYYSIFAVDSFYKIRPSIIEDDFRPDSIYARARVLYLCPDGRPLNIYFRVLSDTSDKKIDTIIINPSQARVFNDQNITNAFGNFTTLKTKRDSVEILASLYHIDTTAIKDTVIIKQKFPITRTHFYTFYLAGFFDSTRATAAQKLHLELIDNTP